MSLDLKGGMQIDCKEKPMKVIAVAIIGWLQLWDCRPTAAGASQGHPSNIIVTPPAISVNNLEIKGEIFMYRRIYTTADYLYTFLVQHGIKFNNHGYPVIPAECILQETPDEIVPYDHRNACNHPSKTVVCHFANDQRLYPRLDALDKDIDKLCKYLAVGGFDLSPRREHDNALQKFTLLLNRMVDAYRAVHGIKILPNFRTGSIDTINALSSYPAGCNYLVGTLGCSQRYLKQGDILLRAKLIFARPEKLFIYGPFKRFYQDTLDEVGQEYKHYEDFRRATWLKKEVV